MRKKKKWFLIKKELLQNKIKSYHTVLINPDNNTIQKNININNNLCDVNIFEQQELFKNINLTSDKLENDGFRTKKIKLFLNEDQKKVILTWMKAYTLMYNNVNNYFKSNFFVKQKSLMSIKQLKAYFSDIKEKIIDDTKTRILYNNNPKIVNVDKHLLDYAINDSLNRYKSCLTNLKNQNIKHFRLRYLKIGRANRIIKIEKLAFTKNGFYPRALGNIVKCEVKNFNYKANINTTATLQYQSKTKEFCLLLKYKSPVLTNKEPFFSKTKIISIDPGIRPLFNGYANDHILKIGTISSDIIHKKLCKIDRINKFGKMSQSNKQKIINKKYDKIKNMVTDSQWKIIKYLTETYAHIVIGNFSTETMGEKKNGQNTICKMTKRIGNMFKMFQFKQKLKYKSQLTNTKFTEIDEAYTSKCCSQCGTCKNDLGSNKIYKCNNCGLVIDRDINGAKNIFIKAIHE